MDQSGTASSLPRSASGTAEQSTRTATGSASALPPTSCSLNVQRLMMSGYQLMREDEEYRKEVAKHLS